MIVCHCNRILEVAIAESARELGTASGIPTPHEVYGLLGKQPCCGGCLPLAQAIIMSVLPGPRSATIQDEQFSPAVAAE